MKHSLIRSSICTGDVYSPAGLDILGSYGAGSPGEGQLEAARTAALEAVQRCCTDKNDARKASAKVSEAHCCCNAYQISGWCITKLAIGIKSWAVMARVTCSLTCLSDSRTQP
eukprot:GHUV01032033.1.p1 GENE.GHUV01032033.1~~GHUV01032033.1.p1  ORF type:complete len:113 (-),score=8.17 GHUV01032033.1:508-846(-)